MDDDVPVWKTALTKAEPNHLVTCGYRQEDLIGNVPYPSAVYLMLRGELPDRSRARMMDAILTASIDHGITPPSARAARTVASGGVPIPTAVSAGLMSIGDAHGGAIEQCAKLLQETVGMVDVQHPELGGAAERDMGPFAAEIVARAKEEGSRLPGFGHRFHTADPRTARLLGLADETGVAGPHIGLARRIESALEESAGRPLPLNVDGAIGALISDMGFDWRLGKAFFVLGRCGGLVAQVWEEMSRERPMRRMYPSAHEYDGPEERDLP